MEHMLYICVSFMITNCCEAYIDATFAYMFANFCLQKTRYTRPGPLATDSDQDYLVKVKQLFRETCKNLPYHFKVQTNKKDVECYSDKYLINDCQPLHPGKHCSSFFLCYYFCVYFLYMFICYIVL